MVTDTERDIPEERDRLVILPTLDLDVAIHALRDDKVVLLRDVSPQQADEILHSLAEALGIRESLELQAVFASLQGHRQNVGKYFMSVNTRDDYHFIPPHSEGDRVANMQLASFFCFENTTDGGETILFNVDSASTQWSSFRERVQRAKIGPRPLSQREATMAKGLYRLQIPRDKLQPDDQILGEEPSQIPSLTLVDALTKPEKTYSRILDRHLYAYWDSVASIDYDCGREYGRLLKTWGLSREPPGGLELSQLDNAFDRHVWRSGVDLSQLFTCKITHKLAPGEFIVQNNVTWTHSAANWTPGSGVRTVVAAFA